MNPPHNPAYTVCTAMITREQCPRINLYRFSQQVQLTVSPLTGWIWICAVESGDFRAVLEEETARYSFRIDTPRVLITPARGTLELSGRGSGFMIELREDVVSSVLSSDIYKRSPAAFVPPETDEPPEVFTAPDSTSGNCTTALFQAIERLECYLCTSKSLYSALRLAALTEFFLLLHNWKQLDRADLLSALHYNSVWTIEDAAHYVEKHCELQFRLDELAQRCRLNSSYFSTAFKDAMGVPLFEFINQCRIKRACELLKTTSHPVTEIAFETGYNNITFFNRYFKRITGMTPGAYRK